MTPGQSVTGEELQILVQYQLVAALQEREHDLATTQRLAHLGSWSMDMGTGVVTWSDELYRIFGLNEEDTTPGLEAFMSVVHPDERSRVEDALRKALASCSPFSLEYRIRRPDGEERWVRSRGAVDADAENVVIRMHGITQDVTDIEVAQRAGPDGSGAGQRALALDPETAPGRAELGQAERSLRRALDEGQFLLHYQPKVSIESDLITGAEALLRWEDPERGLVPPLEFISLAEESGLIVPIGTWVIQEACRQVAQWHTRFPRQPPLVVSVNVSGRQFVPELIEVVTSALAAAGIGAGQLCLEVTESILTSHSDDAVAILNGLAALGLKLSIDDFGTGYSSLSALKRFPLSELKIDKTFVDGLGHDANDTAIVSATVSMAHALELSVVAEGVETAEQFERLRVLGCQEVQGYLVSRPRPAGGFDQLLADEATVGWRSALRETPTGPRERYRPDRVLVVDDSPEVRQLAQMTLAAAGFEVDEASDGAQGLKAAQDLLPDCVILDVSMPGMSGMEVCRALRSDSSTAGCTIVMLTSYAEAADKVEAFSCGADDYMVKPFSPRDLVSRLRAAMRRRSDTGPPRAPDHETAGSMQGQGLPAVGGAATKGSVPEDGDDVLDPVIVGGLISMVRPEGGIDANAIVEMFLQAAPPRLEELRAAVGDKDPAAIAAIAHGLRGSGASFGARRLALRCEQIEAVAAAAGTAELQALLAEAELEFTLAEQALRKQFSSGRAE